MKKKKNKKRKVPLALSMVLFLWIVSAPALASGISAEYNVGPDATHFPQNKQNEAPMAVNPTDPNNIITGANDEIEEPDCTPATGGSSDCSFKPNTDSIGVYWITNGGKNWNQQILHWVSTLGIASDSDLVVAFGPKPKTSGIGFDYSNGARAYFGALAGCRCILRSL